MSLQTRVTGLATTIAARFNALSASLHAVALSGSWNDLANKPAVGNGGLTEINFSNSLYTKLTNIESDAKDDQTGTEIEALLDAELGTGWKPSSVPSILPSLNLMADDFILPEVLTATRASTGTYVDALGIVKTAPIDRLRNTYDPETGEKLGWLIEESRTNYSQYSEDFLNAAWTKTNSSVTTDGTKAPDGLATATKTRSNTAVSQSRMQDSVTVPSGTDFTLSCFVKPHGTTQSFGLYPNYGGNGYLQSFNLVDGVLGNFTAYGGATGSAKITPYPDGWFLCEVSLQKPEAVTTIAQNLYWSDSATIANATYEGDGTSGVYIWGMQLEVGLSRSSYIPALSTSSVTRSADVVSVDPSDFKFSETEGTLIVEAVAQVEFVAVDQHVWAFSDGTSSNRIEMKKNTGNQIYIAIVDGGAGQCSLVDTGVTLSDGEKFRVTLTWKEDDFAMSINGRPVETDLSGSVPTGLDTFKIGASATNGEWWGGVINDVQYFPRRLSDAELVELTS